MLSRPGSARGGAAQNEFTALRTLQVRGACMTQLRVTHPALFDDAWSGLCAMLQRAQRGKGTASEGALCVSVHQRVEQTRCLHYENRRLLLTASSDVVVNADVLAYTLSSLALFVADAIEENGCAHRGDNEPLCARDAMGQGFGMGKPVLELGLAELLVVVTSVSLRLTSGEVSFEDDDDWEDAVALLHAMARATARVPLPDVAERQAEVRPDFFTTHDGPTDRMLVTFASASAEIRQARAYAMMLRASVEPSPAEDVEVEARCMRSVSKSVADALRAATTTDRIANAVSAAALRRAAPQHFMDVTALITGARSAVSGRATATEAADTLLPLPCIDAIKADARSQCIETVDAIRFDGFDESGGLRAQHCTTVLYAAVTMLEANLNICLLGNFLLLRGDAAQRVDTLMARRRWPPVILETHRQGEWAVLVCKRKGHAAYVRRSFIEALALWSAQVLRTPDAILHMHPELTQFKAQVAVYAEVPK